MRCHYQSLVFTLVAVAQASLGGETMVEGFAPCPASTFEIAQASAPVLQAPLADLLERTHALSVSGKPLRAYQILADAEDTYIGVIEFDYALGRAALDAGRPDKATLVLSRVLALDPRHAGALIDTGRAYLALGNFAQARVTFEALLALDPPPPVRTQLQAYLEQARMARPVEQQPSTPSGGLSQRGYVAAILGRSTNVNQSPTQSQVFAPGLGGTFELSNQNVRKPDRFSGVMGGVDASLPLDGTFSVVGGGEILERKNFHESAFNIGSLGARLGVAAAADAHLLRIQRRAARDYLGGSPSRDLDALALDYLGLLGADTQILAFAQAGRVRYLPEQLKIFDADLVTRGLGVSQKFVDESTAFVTISTGNQKDIGGNPSGSKRQLGLRAGAEAPIQPHLKLMVSAAWERGQYDRLDPAFLAERRDFITSYEIALQYAFDRRTFVRFSLAQTDQSSNVPIYEYERSEGWVMLRYEFQ